jgi:hypothetical protein
MELKENHKEFRKEIETRDIDYLVHFTPTINLLSIYEQGYLHSRKKLMEIGKFNPDLAIEDYVDYMDPLRLDKLIDHINLSIQFPNYFLLNVFQKRHNFVHYQWCIIKIIPDYIFEKDTKFAVCNAASRAAANYGIAGSIQKFRQMFNPTLNVGGKVRTRINLSSKYCTDAQAEVLVNKPIPLSDFVEVSFENEETLNANNAAFRISGFDTSKFNLDLSLFSNQRI